MENLVMFDTPLSIAVTLLLLFGILLAMIVLPTMKKETRKLHEKTLALRKSLNEEGY